MRGMTAIMAALLLLPVCAAAQDKPVEDPSVGFIANPVLDPAPPLTPEQQARLPLAAVLAERVVPPGAMNTMLTGMFGGMLAPLADDAAPDPYGAIARRGIFQGPDEIDEARARRLAAILDPAWEERERRQRSLTAQSLLGLTVTLEPLLRQAMAEMYAIHFNEAELADIAAFFATPSGAAYARQSYLMSGDPRMTRAMMGLLPQALEQVVTAQTHASAATADLPPRRNLADFTANEKKVLAQLLGVSVDALEFTLINAVP